MQINLAIWQQTVETAKLAAANSPAWMRAIEKAAEGVQSGQWIVTELFNGILVTTESGETYHANGVCQCKAYKHGQPCKHRAAARLIELYNEGLNAPQPPKPADERAGLIASIKSAWPSACPGVYLADALMVRFRRNGLEMLSIDFLRGILDAIQ